MSVELLAMICQSVVSAIGVYMAWRWVQKKEAHYLEMAHQKEKEYLALIPKLTEDIEQKVDDKISQVVDGISEDIQTLFTEPTVKKAFGIIGSQGGQSKAEGIVVDQMANDILNSEKFAGIKMAAGLLGLDVDAYIQEHGAVKTIAAAKQLSGMIGIDLMNFDPATIKGLIGGQKQTSGGHAYLGGR